MAPTATQQWTLRTIGIVGTAVFATFFAFTYSIPGWVEDFAAAYIEREAAKRVDGSIDAIQLPQSDSALGRLAQSIYDRNEENIEALREKLRSKAHERMAAAIAEIRNLDCECRRRTEQWLKEGFETDIRLLQAANDRVGEFIQYKYMDVSTELKRDVRIFTGSNAAAFILLLLVSFLNPRAVTHLFVPALLLAASTLVCSYFYVFQQDWLLTIIHGAYTGYAYLGWLGFVFAFLSDIALNHGRVTTWILNTVLNAIGSVAVVAPC